MRIVGGWQAVLAHRIAKTSAETSAESIQLVDTRAPGCEPRGCAPEKPSIACGDPTHRARVPGTQKARGEPCPCFAQLSSLLGPEECVYLGRSEDKELHALHRGRESIEERAEG